MNREWYDGSSSAFYKHADFYFSSAREMFDFVTKDGTTPYTYAHRIGRATVSLEQPHWDLDLNDAALFCSSLRSLKLGIDPFFFDNGWFSEGVRETEGPPLGSPFDKIWSRDDFRRYEPTNSLMELKTAANILITALLEGFPHDYKDASAVERFAQNLGVLERLLPNAKAQRAEPAAIDYAAYRPFRVVDIPDDWEKFKWFMEGRLKGMHDWALQRRGY